MADQALGNLQPPNGGQDASHSKLGLDTNTKDTMEGLRFQSTQTTLQSSRAQSPSMLDTHEEKSERHGSTDRDLEAPPEKPTSSDEKQFLVDWDGPDDPMNPKNKTTARKWVIVIIIAFGSYCVTNTSSLYTTTYEGMNREFGSSRIVATLGLSTFVFGLAVGPMVLGPLSEFYGRRPIYIFAYVGFTIWLIPCAVAQNIQTTLIARFFDGLCGSAFLSVAGGTVGDMFTKETLQAPMLIYSASPFLGPATAPIMGGFINYYASWRWSWYFLLIFSGVMLVTITILVPETYMPVLLRKKAQQKRKATGDDRWKAPIEISDKSILWTVVHSLYRPFLLLFLDPMCFNLCLYSAILLGILYLFFGAFPLVFREVYGFNLWQIGLTFIGLMVGMLAAIASDPIWHKNYIRLLDKREQETGERKSEPEYRLPPAIIGSWPCVIGLFMFGWTCYPSVHWIVPIIGTSFFGFGIILVFSGIFTFLVEAYPVYAASALSANSFARSVFAASFPLFGVQMYNTLNFHWATTLLAFLTLLMAPFPYLFFIYGKRLRKKSKFGST
jgi:multidrug resistance protein